MKPSRAEAKKYLQRIYSLTNEIEQRQREIELMYNPVRGVTFDSIPGAGDADATLHLIQRIGDLEAIQNEQILKLINLRSEIYDNIAKIEDGHVRKVLYLRYYDLLPYRQIAKKMGYSEDRIKKWVTLGLDAIAELLHFITL